MHEKPRCRIDGFSAPALATLTERCYESLLIEYTTEPRDLFPFF